MSTLFPCFRFIEPLNSSCLALFSDNISLTKSVFILLCLQLTQNGYRSVRTHFDFPRSRGKCIGESLSSRPADFEMGWRSVRAHYLHGAVLRPVTASGMDLSDRPLPLARDKTQLCPNSVRVARRPLQPHSQARLGSHVVI